MTLTVFQKGLVLAALPLLFQLAFMLVLVRFQREHIESEDWAAHTKNVIAHTHEIQTAVAEADASVRGYVISGDPDAADAFRAADRDLPGRLRDLESQVGDNPEQTARCRAVRAAADALFVWEHGVEQLVRGGDRDAAFGWERDGHGNVLMADFRRVVAAFLTEEERLDRERQVALRRSRERLNVLFAAGGAAAVACTFVLAYAFRRGIARRFAALEDNARRLAAGAALPPPLAGGDEIARLDQAFRAMAADLTRAADAVRDLYDNAPCGYHALDPDGTFLTVNRTELGWLGYAREEVVGRMSFPDLLTAESRERFRGHFPRFKADGVVRDLEFEMVRKDGSTIPVLLNATAVLGPDGQYLRSRSTLVDLTERKRADAAVRLFADVAQSIPIGLLIYQLDGATLRVRSGNREASRLLNIPLDESAGRTVRDVFPAIPLDQLRRYSAVAASGTPDDLGEFQYGDARVAERWWAVQAFPLPERSVGVAFEDVSARRAAEAEVRRLNAALEGRVRERTAELEAANRELAQRNAENEMFVYSVSHDLRSPLVNLQGFSKELEKGGQQLATVLDDAPPDVRDRGRGLLNGKMAKSLGFIQTAVLRLSGIIDALLRLSRAGRVEYRWEAVDVARVVNQVVGAAQNTVTERGAVIRVGDLPPVWGDRTAVEQVFGNLIDNALAYLDPARPGEIEVACLPPGAPGVPDGCRGYIVRDNGLGIAEGHRQKIFQAFQRAHPGVGSGEGLGLAIVSRVVERHRGRVWVESRPGAGSAFYVALPAPPGAA